MNISVDIDFPKDLVINEIDTYTDNLIYNVARITFDFTIDKKRVPYLSGNLQKATEGYGVEGGNKEYYLGVDDTVDYAQYVWDMPQKTHWTRKTTYAKWFKTEYKNEKELIMQKATENAKRGMRIHG